ncbi:MAG: electron transfer flavoprotein subunit alpha/FixB family protein, partial [Bacillota bacterium]
GIKVTRLTAGGLTQEYKVFSSASKLILGIVPGVWNDFSAATGNAEIEKLEAAVSEKAKLQKEYLAPWTEIAVNEAKIVVAGGSGMDTLDNFNRLYEVGELLEAPVGGSRVAEDKGWIEHKSMIGATGFAIAPKLYIACGISGAVQHLVGVQGAEKTIAVNIDAMCGMMQNADLAVVGDCNEILPILAEKLKKYKRTEAI